MLNMSDIDLSKFPPEERIKKLKELEKKKKEEIAQARKEIKESEDELTERQKWTDKVPIPQFAQEDLVGLSNEAKEMLKASRQLG